MQFRNPFKTYDLFYRFAFGSDTLWFSQNPVVLLIQHWNTTFGFLENTIFSWMQLANQIFSYCGIKNNLKISAKIV